MEGERGVKGAGLGERIQKPSSPVSGEGGTFSALQKKRKRKKGMLKNSPSLSVSKKKNPTSGLKSSTTQHPKGLEKTRKQPGFQS